MLLPIKDMTGNQVGEIELNESVFGAPVHRGLMHQALVRQLANARLGTHGTKTRGEVAGGSSKPWRQKGTGRARQGSIRSPQWVGGGTVFGPRPRKYTKQMPKKMRRAALRSALTVKVAAEEIVVVDKLSLDGPKTKMMLDALGALGIDNGQRVMVVLASENESVQRSANNLSHVKVLQSGYVNIRDLLASDVIVMDAQAIDSVVEWLRMDADAVPAESEESEPVVSEAGAEE